MSCSVPDVSAVDQHGAQARAELTAFRHLVYHAMTTRRDALFDVVDAVLCSAGPVNTFVELSLAREHRRGHGSLYDAINCGAIEIDTIRDALAAGPLPRDTDGRLVLAVDVSPWLRPDAPTSPERAFCHVYGRGKQAQAQMIPGWQFSVIAVVEPGRSSWTAVLDALRLHPDDDATEVTATQLRAVITRLQAAGQHRPGDPDILIVFDAGYDLPLLAFLLADLPVVILGRMRSDRVLFGPPPPPAATGRPARHGPRLAFADPRNHPTPVAVSTTETTRYGTATATAWHRQHPRLERRGLWTQHHGLLPIIEGTAIRLTVDHLPGDRHPQPVWLWCSDPELAVAQQNRFWQLYLRRFDLEHTFRLFKQTLGWTTPKIRSPQSADRWTWLIIIAHTQLRLARPLAEDTRRPWEKPAPPQRLTPARVRRGFPRIHATLPPLASAPKPSKPGPGRPKGTPNTHPATRHHCGKRHSTTKNKQKATKTKG